MKRLFRFDATYRLRVGPTEQWLKTTGEIESDNVKDATTLIVANMTGGIPPQLREKMGDVWSHIAEVKVTVTEAKN